MPVDLNLLVPDFRAKVQLLLTKCQQRGIEMRPNEGLRDPLKQAKYWRQSRTKQQIDARIAQLQAAGAPFLADCLSRVGPQNGAHVTNSVPGFSWHQWGEALDCYWVVNGEAEWSLKRTVNGLNGYMVYAAEAHKLGLEAGLYWQSFVDAPHVQLRASGNPGYEYSVAQINSEMAQRFASV